MGGSRGGGQGSGKVTYAEYLQTAHHQLLSSQATPSFILDAEDIYNQVVGGVNPFSLAEIEDPETDFDVVQARYDTYTTLVDGINHTTDYTTMWNAAETLVDDFIGSDTSNTEKVDAFEQQQKLSLARSYSRLKNQMSFLNAVESTALPVALAIIEAEHNNAVAAFRENVQDAQRRERVTALLSAVEGMTRLLVLKHGQTESSAQMQDQIKRGLIVARTDQIKQNATFNMKESFFKFEAAQHYGSLLGAIGGAARPQEQFDKPSDLSNALAGAGMGASIGSSVMPGIGTAVGAGIGAVAGLLS